MHQIWKISEYMNEKLYPHQSGTLSLFSCFSNLMDKLSQRETLVKEFTKTKVNIFQEAFMVLSAAVIHTYSSPKVLSTIQDCGRWSVHLLNKKSPCLISHYSKKQKTKMVFLLDVFSDIRFFFPLVYPCNNYRLPQWKLPTCKQFIFMKWCHDQDLEGRRHSKIYLEFNVNVLLKWPQKNSCGKVPQPLLKC